MDLFDMMSRLEGLKTDTLRDPENLLGSWRDWLQQLLQGDQETLTVFFDKLEAFSRQEMDVEPQWEDVPEHDISKLPEPVFRAWSAMITYAFALYKAHLAREALDASGEQFRRPQGDAQSQG